MSVIAMGQIWYSALKPFEMLVLLSLADFASDDGTHIYPSVATISRKTRLSASTVRTILGRLEQQGILECLTDRKGGRGRPAVYRIHFDKIPTEPKAPAPGEYEPKAPAPGEYEPKAPAPGEYEEERHRETPPKGTGSRQKAPAPAQKAPAPAQKAPAPGADPLLTIREPLDGTVNAHARAREESPPPLVSASLLLHRVRFALDEKIGKAQWDSWLRGAQLMSAGDLGYILLCKTSEQKRIIRERYADLLMKAIGDITRAAPNLLIELAAPPASLEEVAV